MDPAWEQKVRERAYAIWEWEGRPEDRAEEIWLRAERELLRQSRRFGWRPERSEEMVDEAVEEFLPSKRPAGLGTLAVRCGRLAPVSVPRSGRP